MQLGTVQWAHRHEHNAEKEILDLTNEWENNLLFFS